MVLTYLVQGNDADEQKSADILEESFQKSKIHKQHNLSRTSVIRY